MHTVLITAAGLALLFLSLGLAKHRAAAAGRFIPVWGLICFFHLGYGVGVHHYSFVSELGVHVIVFGLPAGVAFWLSRALKAKG